MDATIYIYIYIYNILSKLFKFIPKYFQCPYCHHDELIDKATNDPKFCLDKVDDGFEL